MGDPKILERAQLDADPVFTLSVVSHGQAALVHELMTDLEMLTPQNFEVILTVNTPEDVSGLVRRTFPVRVINNLTPKGFGANHNAAFEQALGRLFVVVNPDIRAPDLQLEELRIVVEAGRTGACAPLVVNGRGDSEDSARRFPTFRRLMARILLNDRSPDYGRPSAPSIVDWVAGMFIVFRREAFQQAGGFDARRFFMYYEDVDLCERLHRLGWAVQLQPSTRVVHNAQRASHRNLRHFRWHAVSAIRYLTGL
jgi:N-acetylglucosaminyl-diphospho-decaprenol L-rhamnosyltransferase